MNWTLISISLGVLVFAADSQAATDLARTDAPQTVLYRSSGERVSQPYDRVDVLSPALSKEHLTPECLECTGEVCEECLMLSESEADPSMISRGGSSFLLAASSAPSAVDVVVEIVNNAATGGRQIRVVGLDGVTVTGIPIAAGDVAADGTITNPAIAKRVSDAIKNQSGAITSNGRKVGRVITNGLKFTLPGLFLLALESSAAAGQYAGEQMDAWLKVNNRGENCSKLLTWIGTNSKACLAAATCEDCYKKRIETIPGAQTAARCYADLALAGGGADKAIEKIVNERAQSVVRGCGGAQGGFHAKDGKATRPFDGVDVPSLAAVCPNN